MVLPAWVISLIVSAVLSVAAYVITPKPKAPRPAAVEDAKAPSADKGRPAPKVWGTITVRGSNVLWWGDRSKNSYMIKV
jgi:hypothetical protein